METACRTSRAKADIITISLVTALCLAGDSLLYIALPLHWEEAGLASLFEVGLILAANRVVRIPLNPLITRFYGRFSCWTGLLVATVLSILSTAGYGLGQGLAVWLFLRFLWGLAWTLLRLGTLFTILRLATPSTLGHLTGLNNGLYRLGSLAGMLLGGLLADSFGLQVSAFVFAALAALAPVLLLRRLPRDFDAVGEGCADRQAAPSGREGSVLRRLFGDQPCAVLMVMMTAFLVAMAYQGVTASTISVLLDISTDEALLLAGFTLSAATLSGVLQALRWVWEPFLAPLAGRLSDSRRGRIRLTALSSAAGALTLFLGAQTLSLPWLCLVLLLVLLAATILTTASDALGNEAALHSANPRLFLSGFALFTDLGAAAGPLLAYAIIALADVHLAWVVTGLSLAVLALYWSCRKTLPGETHA